MDTKEYFRGKSCVITGAASGIGFALSEALLQLGAVVFMADLNEKSLADAIERLDTRNIYSESVDVTKQNQVQKFIHDAATRHGSLDFLFNNAGVGGTMPIGEATLAHWKRIIDINLWGVIYGVDAALPIMRRQGSGHIVNTASIAGLIPPPYQALYCASKYAVVGLSESLRFELADEGIHISVVCPGNVATAIFGGMKPPSDAISAEEAAQIILKGVANKEGIIVFPEKYHKMWREYWHSPEAYEKEFLLTARTRRKSYETKGTYY